MESKLPVLKTNRLIIRESTLDSAVNNWLMRGSDAVCIRKHIRV